MSRPLHIAIDCRKAPDLGIGRYIRGLVDGLQSIDGDDRFTLLVDERSAPLLPREGRFAQERAEVGHYTLREPFAVGRIVDRIAPDVFHAPHYVVPVTRVPCVVTIHDLIHLQLAGMANLPRRFYARVMLKRAVRNSAQILTVSTASASQIEGRWPDAGGRITVTPNGVDERFFAIERSPDPARPMLLYVGNDKPHKNLDRLVAAWSRAERPASARLVVAGSSPARFAETVGVEIAGRVDEAGLFDLYRRATALILPSLEEGFGLPVAEAMAAGVAVLASNIPPIVEITQGAATLFDPMEIDSIAASITRVFSGIETIGRASEEARKAARRFSWSSTAAETLAAYRRAAG